MEIRDFRREKENYKLQSLEDQEFVYVYKTATQPDEPTPWLCATCFDRNKKSIMQFSGENLIDIGCNNWKCHVCNTVLVVSQSLHPN